MEDPAYHPEPYWSTVAREIAEREGTNVVAGDDEPYYVYKREKFLRLLLELPLADKSVLEIGPGPGGNLLALEAQRRAQASHAPARLGGCDISDEMLKIARSRVAPTTELCKTDGVTIPLDRDSYDVVFSATVLQHNSDDAMMRGMLAEMARVAREEVVLFEQVDGKISGTHLRMARPVAYYASILAPHGFELADTKMIRILASYYVSGAIRKLFNPASRAEGEPSTKLANALQRLTLPLTKALDPFFGQERDLARMRFVRRA